jgi:hypothetical protein
MSQKREQNQQPSAFPWLVLNFHRNSSYSLAQMISIGSNIQAEAVSLRPFSF